MLRRSPTLSALAAPLPAGAQPAERVMRDPIQVASFIRPL